MLRDSKMNNLIKIIDGLEKNFNKLLIKYDLIRSQNKQLTARVKELEAASLYQSNQLKLWEEKFSALKNANAMLGSDEHRRETKLKINALIKEIDMCITQLSN